MSDVNGPTGQTPASNGPEDAAVGTAGTGTGAEAATGSTTGSAAESVAGAGAPTAAATAAAGGRRVRVVLVDDHRMFRTGVQAEIGETERTGVEVVGEAADVDQAVTVITATRPEVVLLDVHLPGGGGVEVLRRCAPLMADARQPVRFLALSVSDAAEDVIGVIRGGARGYVTKTITGTDLVDSIFRVQDGDAVFSPRLAGFVLDAFASTDAPPVDEDLDRLTQREREVLRLIARGYAYKEIAKQLFISVKTVESHVSAVLRKLQLSNRHELTRWATARRLV
ncbi:response regulator transcription factor [Streptomyces mirabilis]|uniref:response regulator transcription factor n=1 Tax=Streptomyces mirabilis TaxID=68239 RepID=UPI00331B25AE